MKKYHMIVNRYGFKNRIVIVAGGDTSTEYNIISSI